MSIKDEDRNLGVAGDDESIAPTAASRGEHIEADATNSELREPVVRKWVNKTKIKAAGALMVTLLPALAGLYEFGGTVESIVQPVLGDSEEDIRAVVRGHYEAIGERDFERAFDFYGPRQEVEVGGKEKWIEERTKEQEFCPIEKAEVKDAKVTDIEEDTAVATADVHFGYKCGQEDWRYSWTVSKVDEEWKLDSREVERATSTPVPVTFVNEGRTESLAGGKTKEANLKSVKTSATANDAKDGSDNYVTYEPELAVDGKLDTAWQVALEDDNVTYHNAADGQPDIARQVAFKDGKEPWVLLEYDNPITVSRVGIIPGYNKKDPADGTDRFYQMYTVRKARIEFSDGYSTDVDFEQDPEMRYVDVPNTETNFVRIKILDTYSPRQKSLGGVPYEELFGKIAISEIEVEGA
jgi:hypothetical protein